MLVTTLPWSAQGCALFISFTPLLMRAFVVRSVPVVWDEVQRLQVLSLEINLFRIWRNSPLRHNTLRHAGRIDVRGGSW